MEPLPKMGSNNLIGVMTPRFALGGDVLQASLTIIPAAAQNGLRGRTMSRHSVANVLEVEPQWEGGFREIYVPGTTTVSSLPSTRHSKSLDQLETQQQQNMAVNSLPRQSQQISLVQKSPMPALTYHTQQPVQQQQQVFTSKKNTAEDLLKNINELKEKYRNDGNKSLAKLTNDVHPNKLTNGPINHHLNQPATIFPKEIHLNSNTNVLTLNRISLSSNKNNPMTDYVHELKLNNNGQSNNQQHLCYYNSLPKHAGMAIPPRNSFPPIRGKKSGSKSKNAAAAANKGNQTNTIPRSNSSQALRQQQLNGRARMNGSRFDLFHFHKFNLLTFYKIYRNGSKSKIDGNDSTSTDQSTTITPKRRSKRLLSSRSVPFKLELLDAETNNEGSSNALPPGFSESLPNLAPPPPAFSNSPPLSMKSRNRASISESTSTLSEQSGYVSSHRSSLPSSPENFQRNKLGMATILCNFKS